MRAEWVDRRELEHVLAALTPENRLVCETALETGLRVGDVLLFRTDQVRKRRFTVQEQKTGKRRSVRLSAALADRILARAGALYAFPGRNSGRVPRTRQAVYKDLRRAAVAFRVPAHISPHSLRKAYAVELMRRTGGDLAAVQRALNHGDSSVTLLYALADKLTQSRKRPPR